MNQTITDMLSRRSVRKYTSEQITDDELNTILQAGLYAASGMNGYQADCRAEQG